MHKTEKLNWVGWGYSILSEILVWDSDNSYNENWLKDLKNKIKKRETTHYKATPWFELK